MVIYHLLVTIKDDGSESNHIYFHAGLASKLILCFSYKEVTDKYFPFKIIYTR